MTAVVRSSRDEDVEAITAIYAHYVLNSVATFEIDPPDPEEISARRKAILGRNLPYLVAEEDGQILGFAYAGLFRARFAYRFAVEDSIYLAANAAGKGLGKKLLSEVIVCAEAAGRRQMIAGIADRGNVASIALHKSLGFQEVGVFEAVGFKFGRWIDVVQMQRSLGPGDATPPAGA